MSTATRPLTGAAACSVELRQFLDEFRPFLTERPDAVFSERMRADQLTPDQIIHAYQTYRAALGSPDPEALWKALDALCIGTTPWFDGLDAALREAGSILGVEKAKRPIIPIPADKLPRLNEWARSDWARKKFGEPVLGEKWRDSDGRVLWCTADYERDGAHSERHYHFCEDGLFHDGIPLSSKRPLLHLPEILGSALPVVVVASVREASIELPTHILTTFAGETTTATDWTPLGGRDVTVWLKDPGPIAAIKKALPQARILETDKCFLDIPTEEVAAFITSCAVTQEIAKPNVAKNTRGPSASTILLQLVFETDALLFHEGDETYCSFVINGHTETGPLLSRPFRRYLSRLFFQALGGAPSEKAIKEALGVLDAKARHDGHEMKVYSRYAPDGAGGTYIDQGDADWTAFHITPSGYAVEKSPVRFIRPDGQKPLPTPVPGGSIDELRNFWNVGTDAQFRLAIVFVLQAMRPVGPYAGEEVDGPQGAGKTSFVESQKALIDPNLAPIRSAPRTEVDLIIAARGSRCPCFGNLSRLSTDMSDQLCRLSDGAGIGKRTLYSDLGETIAYVQRPFILNGINHLAYHGDLLDREFRITLKAIPEEQRKTPEECAASWALSYPRILGAIYDLMARTLAELPRVERPEMLPRMASVALFGVAVERAAGWPEGSFMEAYRENIRTADESALESSPIFEIMQKRITEQWKGTAAELLLLLDQHDDHCDLVTTLGKSCTCGMTNILHDNAWPKNARSLSAAIRRLHPNAERQGWKITTVEEGHDKIKTISIEKGSEDVPF